MPKAEKIAVQMRIADIHEVRFFIQHSTELTPENIKQETAYQVQVQPSLVNETEHLAIAFDIKLILKKKTDTVLLHYAANMTFEIGGFELSTSSTDPASIPTEMMHNLMAASYSTMRGLLYIRCAGSILRHAILPLHDTAALLKNHKQIKATLVPKPSALK